MAREKARPAGALDDLRVIELAEGWVGPLCGRLLAELGAQVIKVEPSEGDWLRSTWPEAPGGDGSAFHLTSTQKQSVVLNHRADSADGRHLRALLMSSDVMIVDRNWFAKNSLAGQIQQLLVDAPQLIVCSLTPFGRVGALSSWVGSDLVVQAMSGIMATTGFPDDPPTRAGPTIADHAGALYGAASILAALHFRDRTGYGQDIDISMHDCLVNYMFQFLSSYFVTGLPSSRQGNRHLTCAPWNAYPCQDGWVVVSTVTDQQWETVAGLCGRGELVVDPRFRTRQERMRHVDDVDAIVRRWTLQHTVVQATTKMNHQGIPAAPIYGLDDLLGDQNFRGRQMIVDLEGSGGYRIKTSGSLFKLSETPGRVDTPAPKLGGHTEAVLAELTEHDSTITPVSRTPPNEMASDSEGPLTGILVVELGGYGAGPYCTRLLAELGAEVIKVEPPEGDPMRHLLPQVHGVSYPFHIYNLNKKSMTLDLRSPVGHRHMAELLDSADVLLENLVPGSAERLGLGYEAVAARNPGLIYCSVSGFGQRGPYRQRRAFDTTVQALSAAMGLTGRRDREPTKIGPSIADLMSPTAATVAILAALHWRDRVGRGQQIDVSMQDVIGWSTQAWWPCCFGSGGVPRRDGNHHPSFCPHNSYQARDARIVISVQTEEEWRTLVRLIGAKPSVSELHGAEIRLANQDIVDRYVEDWVTSRSATEVVEACQAAGISAGPVLDIAEVVHHPQVQSRGLIVDIQDEQGRPVHVLQSVFRLSRTPGRVRSLGPSLAQHSAEILSRKASL
ncbi:MAG: CoA transferase [Betaproteobacteria bacterium]|nr:CoA transferase [Betaproteobacteria bacterium]